MPDDQQTVAAPCRTELRVRGSRFIATAWPAASVEEAQRLLQEVHRDHPDATHYCWAYRISDGTRDLERGHDAGEPAGTAGAPILRALKSAGAIDVLLTVVRYFGGTKLGKGGLARAYRDAARGALAVAARVPVVRRTSLRLRGPTRQDGEARHLIARHGGAVTDARYLEDASVLLRVVLPADAARALLAELRDGTRGAWAEEARDDPSGS